MAEHRPALGEVPHHPGRRVTRRPARTREQVRAGEPAFGLARVRPDPGDREPETPRLALPRPAEFAPVDVALGRPRQQRGARRQVRIVLRVAHPAFGHRRLDLRAAGREGVDDRARDALDLEPPVGMGFLQAIAEFPEALGEFGAVDRPDRHLAVEQTVIDHRAPLAVAALDHVGDDGVRVKLGIQVAGRVMAEGGRDHLLAAGPDHRPGGLVAHPGLDGVRLDPAEGRAHRPVVRLDDAPVAAHHRHQGDGLRRAQRHVPAGPVRDAAVEFLAPETAPARNLAFEDAPERLRIDRAGEAERFGALAFPGARLAVRPVVPGVVAVLLEIAHALRRRGDLADRGDHRGSLPPGAECADPCLPIQARYALARQRTSDEHPASYPCHRMAPIVPPCRFDRTRHAGRHA